MRERRTPCASAPPAAAAAAPQALKHVAAQQRLVDGRHCQGLHDLVLELRTGPYRAGRREG